MKLLFENWLEENVIPDEAIDLFKESIACYRIGAYRSAFIMSYIAMQNILKNRILNASFKPNNIPQKKWNEICNKLRDEDEWDKEVSECVKRSSPNNIFLISSSTVSLYESFRVIRNKCAHGKSGRIEYYNIESLWGFIQENYLKFVINGSVDGIIQMIKDHYDPSITPINSDISYIVTNIIIGIKEDELDGLLEEIYIMSRGEKKYGDIFSSGIKTLQLWDKLVNESTLMIQEHIINFFKNNHPDEIDKFVSRYPHTADLFLQDSQFVRKIWTTIMFSDWNKRYEGTWIILDKLLESGAIPESEFKNFNTGLHKFIDKTFPTNKIYILQKTNYFELLKNRLFNPDHYKYPHTYDNANSNVNAMIRYIDSFGLDTYIVTTINNILQVADYGPFFDTIHYFLSDEKNLSAYQKIIMENELNDNSSKLFSE